MDQRIPSKKKSPDDLYLQTASKIISEHEIDIDEEKILDLLQIKYRWPEPSLEVINQCGNVSNGFFDSKGFIYYDRWKDTFEYEKNADYNWLENDILRFYNNDIALMNGVHIDYINRYKRLFMLHDKDREDINHLIRLYLRYDSKQMVNRLLGILTSKERIDLVDFVENRLT